MTPLDIVSDPICPWCHIGKANLFRALDQRPGHTFLLRWRPFQLNPDMASGGMDRRAYLEAKFGGAARVDAAEAQVSEAAARAGLSIDWARVTRVPNTLDAHRLLRWAAIERRQTPVALALFSAYWDQGQDIGDHAVLAGIAASAGMDRGATARLLAGDADRAEVQAEDAEARRIGITGVPTFIVGGRHAVVGAQPPETWAAAIDDLARMSATLQ